MTYLVIAIVFLSGALILAVGNYEIHSQEEEASSLMGLFMIIWGIVLVASAVYLVLS